MFKAIKEFFFGKPTPAQPEAPYKVEAPAFKPTADAAPVESVVETSGNDSVSAAPKVKPARQPRAKTPAVRRAAAKKPTPTP
jgi:hypothetical protein